MGFIGPEVFACLRTQALVRVQRNAGSRSLRQRADKYKLPTGSALRLKQSVLSINQHLTLKKAPARAGAFFYFVGNQQTNQIFAGAFLLLAFEANALQWVFGSVALLKRT
jgi:hypothetical protein